MHDNTRYTWNKNFSNGDFYNGNAIGDNVKDGMGEYYWAASGATYKGEWKNDLMHGRGVLTVPAKPSATPDPSSSLPRATSSGYTYDGDFLGGKRAGRGTCRFSNGRQYEGEWVNDQMQGQGTLHGAPGVDDFATYTGAFQMGVRSGPTGVCHYLNGDVYEGAWHNGKRHGQGELRLGAAAEDATLDPQRRNGMAVPVKYRGPFVQDVPMTGPAFPTGEIQYDDGSSYVGGVNALHREGEGTLRFANGDVYQGQFHRGCREGRGTLTIHNGSTYEGTWVRDKLSGRVTFKRVSPPAADEDESSNDVTSGALPSLVSYQGPCVDGELSGAGARATYGDGSTYKGGTRQGLPDGNGVWEQCRLRGLPQAAFGDSAFFSRYEGQLMRGVPEGKGTATLLVSPNSSLAASNEGLPPHTHGMRVSYRRRGVYAGQWLSGLPHGAGVWKWEGGEAYTGNLEKGVAHGHGCLKNAQETYRGNFSNGQADGEGTYEHHILNERYDGEWSRGLFHGRGTYTKQNARDADARIHYQGAWLNGQKHGEGCETAGALCYTGAFVQGRYEGHGVLHMNGSTILHGQFVSFASYEGQFHDGSPSGKGKMVMGDGSIITGQFAGGAPNGPCEAQFAQGIHFDGVFENGAVVGEGRLRYPNGDQYVGMLEPSTGSADRGAASGQDTDLTLDLLPQRHGKGIFTFAEGNQLSCVWVHNVLNGEGTYTVAGTGEKQSRHYVDGVLCANPGDAEANVFTPENMFPNTQSEEALKAKLVAKKRKPFAFVRKGETRQAANAPRAEGESATPEVTHDSDRGRRGSSSGPNRAAAPRRTSARGGSVDGKAARRNAAEAAGGGAVQPIARKAALSKTVEKRSQSLKGQSPRPSLRGSQEARRSPNALSSAHSTQASTPTTTTPPTAGRLSTSGSRDLLERFQNSIVRVDTQTAATAQHGLTSADDFPSQSALTGSAGRDSPHRQDRDPVRPRGLLTGSLKTMMEEASAIRSSKEDEIHLLTEELRQLNEKIWQLRFSLTSTEPNANRAHGIRTDVLAARLATLTEERTGTVDKLACLLRE